jgi:hypothetical protein
MVMSWVSSLHWLDGAWTALPGLVVGLAACLPVAAARAQQPPADAVYENGRIYTVDANNSLAQAVAMRAGRFVAVGSNEAVAPFKGPDTRVVNLAGKSVVPGLIDAHGHMTNLGFGLERLDFVGTTSYEEIIAKVVEKAGTTPAGEWILGRGWDQNDWTIKDFPDHRALSAAVPDHPVWLTRIDGHAGLANAKAMELAGVTAATADPEGGKVVRRAGTNEPLGVFVDQAEALVGAKVPAPTDAQIRRAMGLAIAECLKYGLTGVHDPGIDTRTLDVYKRMVDDGQFDLRVYAMIRPANLETVDHCIQSGPLIDYGDRRLTCRAFKITIDGALGSRGAALLEDYSDDPGNRGLITVDPAFLRATTRRALAGGWQVCTHAIGDRGNRLVLDVFEDELGRAGARDARLRIEHAQVVALEDIPRFARAGIIPAMQATHATSDMYWAADRVGPERIKGAYAWQRFLKLGCRIPNGSDFPVEGVNPLWGFYAAITRQDQKGWPEGGWHPDQTMTRLEALRSFTIDAAYAAFQEGDRGSIEPGKLADLVVLSQDIMEVPPAEVLKTAVEQTILGGQVVYRP